MLPLQIITRCGLLLGEWGEVGDGGDEDAWDARKETAQIYFPYSLLPLPYIPLTAFKTGASACGTTMYLLRAWRVAAMLQARAIRSC